ncbi:MAG: site-2 protease family protein [Puniceicoccales bacterium]|jgi:membrane-associated protease RseP (regulator of RpoE activity)|nr:site-2 protease family protein [Puniceicoccales bacterium]
MTDIFSSLANGALGVLYVVLFFGGSIFVHELGHFLAARKFGFKIERFSIGFGPRLFGWTGKDGVDYRISLLPLGGYVSIPGLSESPEDDADVDAASPAPRYLHKVVVYVAGVVFNLLFAFFLACILAVTGRPVMPNSTTTVIGDVAAEISPGKPSPAAAAGLRPGDEILAVDGSKVSDFTQIINRILLGAGRDAQGNPSVTLRVRRDGKEMDITAHPELRNQTGDRARVIGISPAGQIVVSSNPVAGYPAALAGLKQGDTLVALDGEKLWSFEHFENLMVTRAKPSEPGASPRELTLRVRGANGGERDTKITPVLQARTGDLVKISHKEQGVRRTLTLVPVPRNALAKKAPPATAPRDALMLFSIGTPQKESKIAETLHPGLYLSSIEQKDSFKSISTIDDLLDAARTHTGPATISLLFRDEDGTNKTVVLDEFEVHAEPAKKLPFIGVNCATKAPLLHQNPFEQIGFVFQLTFDSLGALLNRNTDVGPNQLMGVISMGRVYFDAASILQIIWFTIMINISLAILNILPLPILDGGHIVFATLRKILGKPLPKSLFFGIHYVAMALFFLAMAYVLFNDVKRCSGDSVAETRSLIYERYIQAKLPGSMPATPEAPPAK